MKTLAQLTLLCVKA